jgi:hypothetical protein
MDQTSWPASQASQHTYPGPKLYHERRCSAPAPASHTCSMHTSHGTPIDVQPMHDLRFKEEQMQTLAGRTLACPVNAYQALLKITSAKWPQPAAPMKQCSAPGGDGKGKQKNYQANVVQHVSQQYRHTPSCAHEPHCAEATVCINHHYDVQAAHCI